MSLKKEFKMADGSTALTASFDLPDFCPFCQRHSAFTFIQGYYINTVEYKVLLGCNNSKCNQVGIAVYWRTGQPTVLAFHSFEGGNPALKQFPDSISKASESFVNIYNQAEAAEQYKLVDVCGVGYRKALEFLIKDYLILHHPDKAHTIKKTFISTCIEEYIDNGRIKDIAKRATWLGNDETHYEKRWVDKTLKDLKNLIDLVVHYIDSEALYESTMETMPS